MAFVEVRDNGLRLNIEKLTPELQDTILNETRIQSAELTRYIIVNHLTGGTTGTKLGVRSGNLRRLTLPIIPIAYSQKMKGGTQFAAKYAGTHVGPQGQVTTIKPIRSKYLAIPILNGLSATGASRYGSPRNVPGLKFIPRKGKSPLLARVSGGILEPFYVLKKESKVKARVHPKDILKANLTRIAREFNESIEKTLGKVF
jgi:hypothetical protein